MLWVEMKSLTLDSLYSRCECVEWRVERDEIINKRKCPESKSCSAENNKIKEEIGQIHQLRGQEKAEEEETTPCEMLGQQKSGWREAPVLRRRG